MSLDRKEDRYYEGLNEQLRNLAYNDWATFCQLIGEKALNSAKVCILLKKGLSMERIAMKLTISKREVQLRHENKCDCELKSKLPE